MLYAETKVNVDEGFRTPEREIEAPRQTSIGELFSLCQQQYGRCTGKARVDTDTEEGVPVGWVFERRRDYADSDGTFLERTWVTVLSPTEDGVTRRDLRA